MKQTLEEKLLKSFKKHMNKEVEDLDLIVCVEPDTWPDDFNVYSCIVEESNGKGKVWDCTCTKNGIVKHIIEL